MSDKEKAFWSRYAENLGKHGVSGRNAEWHILRAQDFVYGLENLRLRDVSSVYLDSYLAEIGRNPKLEAWQVRQVVYALRILFLEMTKLEWPAAYDWEGQLSACEELKKVGLVAPHCVWDPDWVVDCRHVGNGQAALKYLSQYVFRVAISPGRIIRAAGGEVWFKYQRSGEKKWRTCRLKVFEFIRRYLQHVLPHGFTKVRHYGFLAPNCRVPLARIREVICRLYEIIVELLPEKKPARRKPWICRTCGGLVRWREFIPCPRGAG